MNKFYKFGCDVSEGRLLACKDSIGGLNKIYLMTYTDELIDKFSLTGQEITEITAITIYKYDLRPNTGGLTINWLSDPATGTTYYEQVLEVTLQKIVREDLASLDNILKGRCQAFVLDANDNVFVLGTRFGCDITAGTMATGVGKADLSGFTLTFTGQETENYIVKKSGGLPAATGYPFDNIDTPANVTIEAGTTPA